MSESLQGNPERRDVGFYLEGIDWDLEDRNKYILEDKEYDDDIMYEAINSLDSGEYNLITNNCQDFADAARERYHEKYRDYALKKGSESFGR